MTEQCEPTEERETYEPLYLVAAFMTRKEYEEHRKRPGTAGFIHLQEHTKYGGQPYGEEHLPQIIWDAAARAGLTRNGAAADDDIDAENNVEAKEDDGDDQANEHNFLETFDTSEWPFMLKHGILDAVRRHWTPPSEHVMSQWWEKEEAKEFFEDFPELKLPFTEHADAAAVARRWLESQEKAEN